MRGHYLDCWLLCPEQCLLSWPCSEIFWLWQEAGILLINEIGCLARAREVMCPDQEQPLISSSISMIIAHITWVLTCLILYSIISYMVCFKIFWYKFDWFNNHNTLLMYIDSYIPLLAQTVQTATGCNITFLLKWDLSIIYKPLYPLVSISHMVLPSEWLLLRPKGPLF